MDAGIISLLVLLVLITFLASGAAIFVSIICASIFSLMVFLDFDMARLGATLSRIIIRSTSAWELAAIPLFIWMGEIVYRSSLVDGMFKGLSHLVRRLPGGLMHTTVMGSAMFAAVSGSSTATTATVGKIVLSELDKRGYDKTMAIGSLAGAGTLGLLIPPSIILIIYGMLAQVSIIKLFAAGVVPGLLIAFLYSAYIAIRSGKTAPAISADDTIGLGQALWKLMPIVALMVAVLGSIYSGHVTPSESAAIGVLGSFVLLALRGELTFSLLKDSLLNSIPTTCMIVTLMSAAAFLSTTLGFLHIPQDVAAFIGSLNLNPFTLLIALSAFYILLGLLLDGISITVMTLPITLPLVIAAGIDPLWFGIFLVILVELAQITPPVGFNLFVIQSITGEPVLRIARCAAPYFVLMCVACVLLAIFPQIVMWLPQALYP